MPQITVPTTQLVGITERLAQELKTLTGLEHLLSRNSGNFSMPPSRTTVRAGRRRATSAGTAGRFAQAGTAGPS
ncbi:hypothetical protein ABZ468_50965 [Streptomyces sp. NPDC005708]|uniref:hypothetical protein n=1 Tax=unclassified Streptomyces TaxID=2593676 RepID=UPI0033DA60F0